MTAKIAPCLWFDGRAEEAAAFYVSIFPDSRVTHVVRSPTDTPGAKAGSVILVEFSLSGQSFQALNGGPHDAFNDAISLSANCADQAEVDRLWDALSADGGRPVQCGWLKDKFGVSWQIVPEAMMTMLRGEDPEPSRRAMEAMMQMVKLDIAELKRAYQVAGAQSSSETAED
ncbi:MAG: VOC family protein [Rhodospirillales bacterium]|nr:VOC family protein [Rhodospirillales bacterium]